VLSFSLLNNFHLSIDPASLIAAMMMFVASSAQNPLIKPGVSRGPPSGSLLFVGFSDRENES
jgi:predicted amino acid dehydrogenase